MTDRQELRSRSSQEQRIERLERATQEIISLTEEAVAQKRSDPNATAWHQGKADGLRIAVSLLYDALEMGTDAEQEMNRLFAPREARSFLDRSISK